MTLRQIPVLGVVALVTLVVAVLSLTGGGDGYRVDVVLNSANGLRDGAPVESGGVAVGRIDSLKIRSDERVVARVVYDEGRGPIGSGAHASIRSKNLLGEKFLIIDRGDVARPQRSGSAIPASRVSESVDLDQVLDVLDAPTRARLGILINEAGASVAGRKVELRDILRQLPPSFDAATKLVDEVVNDNHTLGALIERSDRFMATFAAERRALGALVDTAGQTAKTVAQRRPELRETLARAPETLRTLRGFLADLQATAVPLGPAARAISATAPALHDTVAEVTPFQRAARPALDEATKVAPLLTTLGRKATPVLRDARPTVTSLTALAREFQPVSRTLDVTIDDLMAVLQGWSRAIQGRDGLTHMFRAKLNFNADTFRTVISRLAAAAEPKSTKRRPQSKAPVTTKPPLRLPGLPSKPPAGNPKLPDVSKIPLVGPTLDKTVNGVEQLLDYLLGGGR